MGLHDFIFLIRQAGRLVNNGYRDPDLADIMQQCYGVDFFLFFPSGSASFRNHAGVFGYPGRVTAGIGILRINRFSQCKGRFIVQPDNGFQSLVRQVGLALHFVFQIILQIFILQYPPHPFPYHGRHKGFADKIRSAKHETFALQVSLNISRHDNHRNLCQAFVFFHFFQNVKSIGRRHVIIQQHNVRIMSRQPLKCLAA